jgi:hypothetical protein
MELALLGVEDSTFIVKNTPLLLNRFSLSFQCEFYPARKDPRAIVPKIWMGHHFQNADVIVIERRHRQNSFPPRMTCAAS